MIKQVIGATLLASALLIGTGAQAMPAAPAPSQTIQDDDLIQVRDGCGAGRHFSPALGRCVVNYGYYGAPGYYGGRVYGYRGGVYRGGYAYRGGYYRGGRYGYRGGYRGGARRFR
ncbi:hypothetical protein V1291_005529 [Nitrobacteraceae bacterium AZCC 1564]